MKRIFYILTLVLVAVFFSCSKGVDAIQENLPQGDNMVSVDLEVCTAEGSKVIVNGTTTSWEKGDKVAVFVRPPSGSSAYPAYQFTVSNVSGDNNKQAILTGMIPEGAGPFLYAVYPYDQNATSDWNGNIKTYTIPTIQDGSFSNVVFHGTPQKIDKSDDNKKYTFSAISGIVKLNVPAELNVKAIVLTSTDSNKELAGTFTVDYDKNGKISNISNKSKNITVVAKDGEILSGDIYVAVLPQSSGTTFTLSMDVINTDLKYAHFSKTGMKALVKGQIEKLGSLPANTQFKNDAREFSAGINNSNKILFSPGLLQYQPSSSTWRFADDQLSFIGDNPGNNTSPTSATDETNRAAMTDWIDMFPYGHTHKNGYEPYACLNTSSYFSNQGHKNLSGDNDWGANEILNGTSKDTANTWHTPTFEEFQYIMSIDNKSRSTISGVHYCRVVIDNTICGTLLFPDLFLFPDAAPKPTLNPNPFDRRYGSWTDTDAWKITMDQFNALQTNGVVFLHNAGYRSVGVQEGKLNIFIGSLISEAHYWTSTAGSNFYISQNMGSEQKDGINALPVRLIKKVSVN